MSRALVLATALVIGGSWHVLAQSYSDQPMVAGWIETVLFPDQGLVVQAKLDTGADTSSIGARAIVLLRRGAERTVQFEMADGAGRTSMVEAPLVRVARIRRAGAPVERRPVVRIRVCVAGITREAEFTLASREHLDYQVLVGRNVLAEGILVDSGRQRIASDRCGR